MKKYIAINCIIASVCLLAGIFFGSILSEKKTDKANADHAEKAAYSSAFRACAQLKVATRAYCDNNKHEFVYYYLRARDSTILFRSALIELESEQEYLCSFSQTMDWYYDFIDMVLNYNLIECERPVWDKYILALENSKKESFFDTTSSLEKILEK